MLFSSAADNLIDNPDGAYKFGAIILAVNNKMEIINRQTYGLLDWLGDIGGLYDALYLLIKLVLFPFLHFKYSSFLMTGLFRAKPEGGYLIASRSSEGASKIQVLKEALKTMPAISTMRFLFYITCCCSQRRKNYQIKLQKAKAQLEH